MTGVVLLHRPKPCDDVVQGLRRLADAIEAGEVEWPVTTCVVALGHTDAEGAPDSDGACQQRAYWRTHGCGPRTDTFTTKGLLTSILTDWEAL